MRYAALLLTGLTALTVTLAVTVQPGQGESDPKSVTTVAPEPPAKTEASPTADATPEVHRAVIPGLAGDWTPKRCSANVPDPCLLPITQLTVTSADGESSVTLTVEIANRSDQRQRGLMFRESMDELAGMLFVFAGDRSGGFWMRNTLIPLDIAYLGADGTVLEIVHGMPLSLDILTPTLPYRYTLEVNGGWFERQGLGVGDVVAIPAGVEAR
ncbi:MAG: DUF192 domain-containing protein [Dehalococcoidia bacterium]|nr:DUF192 domain-containing protein [Dehalococcoidia bacterium]MYD29952.1 DUF192 domain-containing protein [Dehalococcoidia bacterium]